MRIGRYNEEGMEEVEVHWPIKGKGKGDVKIWHCVVLPEPAARTEQEDIGPKSPKKARDENKQEDIGPKPAKRHHTSLFEAIMSGPKTLSCAKAIASLPNPCGI